MSFPSFPISDQCVSLMIHDPEIFAIWVRVGEAIGGQMFPPPSSTLALQVRNHIRYGFFHRLEFDPHSAAGAVFWRLRFPVSGVEALQPFLYLFDVTSVISPNQK